MKKLKPIASIWAVLFLALASLAQPAFAGDGAKAKYLVEMIEVNPATGSEWNDGWENLNSLAEEGDYPFRETVLVGQGKRWIVTKVDDYAGLDKLMMARDKYAKKHGKKFDRAIAKMDGATSNSDSFISALDDELSYRPEGQTRGAYTKIETHYFRAGSHEKMAKVGADFKALAASLDSPTGWDVWWNGVGSPGSSVTLISWADSPLAMAQADANDQKLFATKQKEVDAIVKDFTDILVRTTTEYAMFKPEMSMNLEDN
ncbi:MAG: hypothetical protein EX271_07115 [Acidimicrobiales bacterium]|nr:hypothetical protein [Hyphomonadaceae bacterium]RZV41868.1 MAG: hypothetical protein EX271_07115 [Acidimicrobiales bacterium]